MKTTKLLLLLLLFGVGAHAQTIVERHGQLHVAGAKILDKCNRPAQLKGMSYFWHQWEGSEFWNANAIKWLRDDWKVEIVRAAMGVRGGDDKLDYINNPTYASGQVRKVVDGAIQHGIYVIIDFHAHPNFKAQAKTFFGDMSKRYSGKPNVIYEIWNEPEGEYGNPGAKWSEIKAYAKEVIAVIRANDPNGLIVVGTPFYDQFVNTAADSPLTTDSNGQPVGNVAYTLHVYADAHRFDGDVGNHARYALQKGLPMFVTESGATGTVYDQPRSSGKNKPNYTEWKKWEDWWDANGISYAKWSLSTKDEFGSSLNPGAPAAGNWDYTKDLTDEGRWNRDHFRAVNTLPAACDGTTPTPAKDAVGSVKSPASVNPGQKLSISVSYSASTARDLYVLFQASQAPYTVYGSAKVAVKAGSGTVSVPLTVGASTPLGSNYQFQNYLTPTGKTWAEHTANLLKRPVSVVKAATTRADNIFTDSFAAGWADWSWSGTATPTDGLAHGGSKAFKFNFSGNGVASFRHETGKTGTNLVRLEFWARTYQGNAGFRVSASYDDDYAHGSATKTIAVTPTYQKFSLSKADLGGFGWYKRLFIEGPSGQTIYLDDVKFIYADGSSSARPATVTAAMMTGNSSAANLNQHLVVYPNPSQGQLTLNLPQAAGQGVRARLYDGLGRVLVTQELNVPAGGSSATLDVRGASLPQGTYLLRVETADGQPLGFAPVVLQ